MQKRKLSKDEKKICEKMIKRFEKELQHLRFLERYYDMMIGEGIYWNYQQRLSDEKDKKKEIVGQINEITFKMIELKKQLLEGVEVKEEKKQEKEQTMGYFG